MLLKPDIVMTARSGGFALRHPRDAIAFPGFVLLIWVVILMGFVPEVVDQVERTVSNIPCSPMSTHSFSSAG